MREERKFSIILPLLDPFDRFVAAGAVQRIIGQTLALEGDPELIVVSNNCTAACPRLTGYLRSLQTSHPHRIKLVEAEKNLGTARGFNAGLQAADPGSAYLVFMSADADIVDPSMLTKIGAAMDSHPSLGIAHPVSVYEDAGKFNFSRKYNARAFYRLIRRHAGESAEIPPEERQRILAAISTRRGIKAPFAGTPLTFAVYRHAMIKEIGPFDEGVEYGCYETYDLGMRALMKGYQVARLNGVFINHRRLAIRNLVLQGTPEIDALPHRAVIRQSEQWWLEKWGRPPGELFAKWKWGPVMFSLLQPYFRLRHCGGLLKRALNNHWHLAITISKHL